MLGKYVRAINKKAIYIMRHTKQQVKYKQKPKEDMLFKI